MLHPCRPFRLAVLAASAALLSAAAPFAPVLAQEATTTRIETRAFYGATVTMEAGVRVFRPLPAHSKVIINPGGRTPLYLSHDESRQAAHAYSSVGQGGDGRSSGAGYDGGTAGGPYGYGDAYYPGSGRGMKRHSRGDVVGLERRPRQHGGPVLRHAPFTPVPVHGKPYAAPSHGATFGGGKR